MKPKNQVCIYYLFIKSCDKLKRKNSISIDRDIVIRKRDSLVTRAILLFYVIVRIFDWGPFILAGQRNAVKVEVTGT